MLLGVYLMGDQVLENLLQEYVSYSELQEKLSLAIQDCDEIRITGLELEGREILGRVGPQVSLVLHSEENGHSNQKISYQGIQSLVKWMEKSQVQREKNQKALRQWKNNLGITLETRTGQGGQEHSLDVNATTGAGTGSPSFPFSSLVDAPSNSTWGSLSRQGQLGQKLDRLS